MDVNNNGRRMQVFKSSTTEAPYEPTKASSPNTCKSSTIQLRDKIYESLMVGTEVWYLTDLTDDNASSDELSELIAISDSETDSDDSDSETDSAENESEDISDSEAESDEDEVKSLPTHPFLNRSQTAERFEFMVHATSPYQPPRQPPCPSHRMRQMNSLSPNRSVVCDDLMRDQQATGIDNRSPVQ